MLDRLKPVIPALALAVSGCASVETSDGSAGVTVFGTSASYHVGGGTPGCSGSIAAFQAVIDNDQKTGNVNQSIYRRAVADLDGVKAACVAGRDAEANNRLAAVKARYGYR